MALKAKLETLDGIEESTAAHYREQDGAYVLDVEDLDAHPGIGALKRAKDYERDQAKKAKADLAALREELEAAQGQLDELRKSGVPRGDLEALEKSYNDRIKKLQDETQGTITGLQGALEKNLLDGSAMRLASDLVAQPEYVELILPHIRGRLRMEQDSGGGYQVRVLDRDGQPTANTVESLKAELLQNKAFGAILRGSSAQGGGAAGANGGGGASSFGGKKPEELTDVERSEWFRRDPEGFKKAFSRV